MAPGPRLHSTLAAGQGEGSRGLRADCSGQGGPRLYETWLAEHRSRLVTLFSTQSGPALAAAGCLEDASAIWSLWHGYLDEPSGKRLLGFLASHGIDMTELHTSGHASVADLQSLASAIGASRVVPIHTFGSARFQNLFDNVTPEEDGSWWEV